MAESILEKTAEDLWWVGMLQGVLAVFFGISAVFWPSLTLFTLVVLFSGFIVAWSIIEIIRGIMNIDRRGTWWMTLLFGLIGLGVGIYLVRHLNASFATFILLISLTLIIRGILDIVQAFIDRATPANKVLSFIVGAAGIIAGILIMVQPVAGGVAFVWVLGLWALVFGVTNIAIALSVREELETLKNGVQAGRRAAARP